MFGAALGKLSSAAPSPSGTTGKIPDLVWKRMTANGATRAVSHSACADARRESRSARERSERRIDGR